MGITTDGNRSLKRLWFAKKLVEKLKALNVPAKTVVYDGFTFMVSWISGIVLGRITAPMGAMVVCADGKPTGPLWEQRGIRLMIADHWLGSFSPAGYFKCLHKPITSRWANFLNYSQDQMEAWGYETMRMHHLVSLYPYPTPDPTLFGLPAVPGALNYAAKRPQPVVLPYKGGEAYFIVNNAVVWDDLSGDGSFTPGTEDRYIVDAMRNFYIGDGASMNSRMTFFKQGDTTNPYDLAVLAYQIMPTSGLGMVEHHTFLSYPEQGVPSKKKLASSYFINVDDTITQGQWWAEDNWAGVPSGLRAIILDTTGTFTSSVKPIGHYAFSTVYDGAPTLLSMVDLTDTALGGPVSGDEATYFSANPSDEHWKLFFTMSTQSGSPAIFSSSNFIGLLDSLATVGVPSTDWDLAKKVMYQLFPSPNSNWLCPYDSTMFHDTSGNVYTWTRKYQGVKFSTTTGLTAQAMTMPAEVTANQGTRPTMHLCGQAGANDLFVCVCEDVSSPQLVRAVYYGSPFSSWTKLPDPPADFHLVNVRPVFGEAGATVDLKLFGVLQDELEPGYNLAFISYIDGVGEWVKLGRLPVDYDDYLTFSVGLFGEGAMANQMSKFLDPPPALQQMPIGPYSGYNLP